VSSGVFSAGWLVIVTCGATLTVFGALRTLPWRT